MTFSSSLLVNVENSFSEVAGRVQLFGSQIIGTPSLMARGDQTRTTLMKPRAGSIIRSESTGTPSWMVHGDHVSFTEAAGMLQ